ncbi:hypothetical protein Tco_0390313 [Tanacetum coccineum]
MAQPQRQADVHQDKLSNILQNRPLKFSIAASSLVSWVYLGKFWHNLKEDGSKYKLSHDELEAKPNVEKVEEHLIAEEIEKLEEESAEDDYELRRREKRKHVEEIRNTPSPKTIRSPSIHSTLVSLDTEKLQELTVNDPPPSSSTTSSSSSKLSATQRLLSLLKPKTGRFKCYKSFFDELQGCYDYLFGHLNTRFLARTKFKVLALHLQEVMKESLPKMVDARVKELTKTQVPIYVAQGLIMERQQIQADVAKMIADAVQEEHKNLQAEITSQINNAITNHIPSYVDSSVRNYMSGHILHVHPTQASQASVQEQSSAIRPRDQDDPHDDAYPGGRIVQKGRRCLSMEPTFLENLHLVYLKKGNSRPEKIVLSLNKFPAVIFPDDDIKERTSIWVYKCVKKQKEPRKPKEVVYSNSKIVQVIKTYWELGHEHKFVTEIIARRVNGSIVSITEPDYKNPNKNGIEDMYLSCVNGKIEDYIETQLMWSLSVFIRSTMIWERVHDFQLGMESYQKKVNLTAPTITFLDIEKYKMFSIVVEPIYGIIYKNNKKEKRVMRHQEIHKFCDATLKTVLEGLKSYNNDVKKMLSIYNCLRKRLKNGGEGDGVANWTSSGVISERVRVMSIDAFLELEGVEELLEEEMLSMEEEEVPLVDGVFKGALGALALEMEALVDAMMVYGG